MAKKIPANILDNLAIANPPAPYIVGTTAPTLDDPAGAWPIVEHSCTQPDGTYGDPAIRINQWVQAFEGNGIFETICNDSFAPALQGIADLIDKKIGAPCVSGNILDTKDVPWTAADTSAPDCTVIDHAENDQNTMVNDTPVPSNAPSSLTATGAVAEVLGALDGRHELPQCAHGHFRRTGRRDDDVAQQLGVVRRPRLPARGFRAQSPGRLPVTSSAG